MRTSPLFALKDSASPSRLTATRGLRSTYYLLPTTYYLLPTTYYPWLSHTAQLISEDKFAEVDVANFKQ